MSDRAQSGVPLSVVVLTFNEEANIGECLDSLAPWADQVFVVDSFSTDRTVEIASAKGADVVQHPFDTHTLQWQWALETLPFRNDWLLLLDADFRIPEALRDAIADALSTGPNVDGYYIPRLLIFRGRPIRHGDAYPNDRLVLVRKDRTFVDARDVVDHHFYVQGRTGRLDHDLIEDNRNDGSISFWVSKQLRMASRQAEQDARPPDDDRPPPAKPRFFGSRTQRVLWMRRTWVRLPLYWRSAFYFLYRYFVRVGFLDGREGFVYHFTQAFMYRVILDARVEELTREQRD